MNVADIYAARMNNTIFISIDQYDFRLIQGIQTHIGEPLEKVIQDCLERWDLDNFNVSHEDCVIFDLIGNKLWCLSDHMESLELPSAVIEWDEDEEETEDVPPPPEGPAELRELF